MPELPEVERAVRDLRNAIQDAIIERVEILHPSLHRRVSSAALRALRGARVRSVERRGKHQLIHLEDGRVIHAHFRLNGDWVIGSSADELPRFARAVFHFTSGMRVVLEDSRALSTLDIHAAGATLPLDLGPEPHDASLTPARLRATLTRRRIPIKVALLDQRIIAGLGNIYASEALWRAKIDPRASAASLDEPAVRRLLAAIRKVIERATGARYTSTEGARLDVYDREGRPCRRCRTKLSRITQSGRSTYFCPHCQRAARVSRAPRSTRS
ncbi:MAG TPA: bifunctional DNA-formamidopyrimidine glycosylase/DNA-(apurinic or apyrimidinic site) lyase [Gemmatimonadaceae bacterium]|nr:bifunctional DNA-formamidopyrimidine glycosylase/DNA-(apurinic or apyrimidinic site) lyase [Gemmatimonadaceae bacterium]